MEREKGIVLLCCYPLKLSVSVSSFNVLVFPFVALCNFESCVNEYNREREREREREGGGKTSLKEKTGYGSPYCADFCEVYCVSLCV